MPDRREIERTVYAFLERAERYIREKDILSHGDIVIAGVSGGADSMCLLDVLITLGKKHGWSVRTVHVHHGIRGSSADEDASYVSAYCEKEGIPLSAVMYIGNDVNDLKAMEMAGFRGAPADAEPEILAIADWVSEKKGGMGVVRELARVWQQSLETGEAIG